MPPPRSLTSGPELFPLHPVSCRERAWLLNSSPCVETNRLLQGQDLQKKLHFLLKPRGMITDFQGEVCACKRLQERDQHQRLQRLPTFPSSIHPFSRHAGPQCASQ